MVLPEALRVPLDNPVCRLDEEAYFAAMGRWASKESIVDVGECRLGERVRERVSEGSKRLSEGECAEGGRRAFEKVSFSLRSSCTYLTVS